MEKAIVIEDEKNVRENLIGMLEDYCPELSIVGDANSVESGISLIQQMNPDIVFLDINLPDGTGFDVLKSVDIENLKVIFITAYGDYALKAIKYSAIDYLLKPVIPDELIEAVQKAQKFIAHDREFYELSALSQNDQADKPIRIVVKTKQESFYLNIDDILYVEADGNYSVIHSTNLKPIMVSKTLKFYEDILDDNGFFRSHQSYLVNPLHIKQLQNNQLLLSNGHLIEISRRKKNELSTLFNK